MKKMKGDDSMDRLLRRTAGTSSGAAASGACLDADVLAALSDGSLTAVERASAESHAAACDRCFAVLSAIVRTAPAAQETASQKRAAWLSLRWMVPLASAAVIVIAFALQLQLQSPADVPAPPAAPAPVPAQPTARANENAAAAAEQKPSPRAAMPQGAKDSAVGAAPPQRRDQEAATLLRKERPQEPAALGAAAEKKVAERPAAVDEVQQKPAAAPAPPPPPAAAAAAAPPPAVAETVAADRNERARSDMRALQQQLPIMLPTPDPNVRWRVNGRAIERSIDGGRTWSGAVTRTDRDVLAGACSAANVCWFAGRSGLVLLTTDGTNWHTISPPEASLDLVSLTATSATAATITAANGRTYRTTDGGRTWTVQELPATPF